MLLRGSWGGKKEVELRAEGRLTCIQQPEVNSAENRASVRFSRSSLQCRSPFCLSPCWHMDFPGGPGVKNSPVMQEIQVWSLGQEDPLEEGVPTHSSVLTWRIPWTEETGRLQSVGLQSRTLLNWLSIHTLLGYSQWSRENKVWRILSNLWQTNFVQSTYN